MATIYRLEHHTMMSCYNDKVGQGCYVDSPIDGEWYERMTDFHANDKTHPNVHVDDMTDFAKLGYFCCFATLFDLEKWFEGFMEFLGEEGYTIHVYEIEGEPIHGLSMKQAMFDPEKIISRKKFEKDLVD